MISSRSLKKTKMTHLSRKNNRKLEEKKSATENQT
jgi:hypothetical protein